MSDTQRLRCASDIRNYSIFSIQSSIIISGLTGLGMRRHYLDKLLLIAIYIKPGGGLYDDFSG
jgi:hypothetical protein